MPTWVATRHHRVIKTFYERLLAQGKQKKVAWTACLRQRWVILNAIAKRAQPWQPQRQGGLTAKTIAFQGGGDSEGFYGTLNRD